MRDVPSSLLRSRFTIARCTVMVALAVTVTACSDPTSAPQSSSATDPLVSAAVSHPNGNVGGQLPLNGSPWGVDVSISGVVYVTQLFTNQVAVSSIRAQTISAEIGVGSIPTAVAFAPDGRTAYVTNQLDGALGVINVATRTQTAANAAVVANQDGYIAFIKETGRFVTFVQRHMNDETEKRRGSDARALLHWCVKAILTEATGSAGEPSLTRRLRVRGESK